MARATVTAIVLSGLAAMPIAAPPAAGQFEEIAVPEAMERLEFMIGDWVVEGAFRTPDHIDPDRALWYLTGEGGIARFDGTSWSHFAAGDSAEADALLDRIEARAEPYRFSNDLEATWVQDGFAILLDEGRTSGTTLIYYDTQAGEWVATAFHAPTSGVTVSRAKGDTELPAFEGHATDRRGPRIFRRRVEIHDADHYTTRTDVSFDDGVSWIEDQIVQEVRRREAREGSSLLNAAVEYLETLYAFDFDVLGPLLAPDAIFADPTAAPLTERDISYSGRDEIVRQFRASSALSRNAGFTVEHSLVTGQYVVLNVRYRSELQGEAFGAPGRWIPVQIDGVTIVRVQDGLVTEHRDYVDYDAMLEQVESATAGAR